MKKVHLSMMGACEYLVMAGDTYRILGRIKFSDAHPPFKRALKATMWWGGREVTLQ